MSIINMLIDQPSSAEIQRYTSRSGGFNYHKFVKDVKKELKVGELLDPRGLYRLSRKYGNIDDQDTTRKKFISACNQSVIGWKRRRSPDGGYIYEKTA